MATTSVLDTIGQTPLVQLQKLAPPGVTVFAKLEYFNPLSSVKDRAARAMVEEAERQGLLQPNGTLIEATSGNMGLGLALVAAVKGYRAIFTMPDNMSLERRKLLAFLGAEIVLTPAADGMKGSIAKAEELAHRIPGAFLPHQFENPANAAAHEKTTGPEIWETTQGRLDFFVAGVGTGGTLAGVAAYLKKQAPSVQIVAVEPAQSPVLSGGSAAPHGLQGIGANFVPPLLKRDQIDAILAVTEEEALNTTRALARQEGILAGISSGAAMAATLRLAAQPQNARKTLVALLPDGAERYLSTALCG